MDLAGHGVRMVRFSAGGHAFAVEARHVRAMLTTAPEQARQAEDLLGLPHQSGPRRWLVMEADGVVHCIEVAEPVRLQIVDAQLIHLPPPLLAARLTLPSVIAITFDHQGPMLVLDPLSLVAPIKQQPAPGPGTGCHGTDRKVPIRDDRC